MVEGLIVEMKAQVYNKKTLLRRFTHSITNNRKP